MGFRRAGYCATPDCIKGGGFPPAMFLFSFSLYANFVSSYFIAYFVLRPWAAAHRLRPRSTDLVHRPRPSSPSFATVHRLRRSSPPIVLAHRRRPSSPSTVEPWVPENPRPYSRLRHLRSQPSTMPRLTSIPDEEWISIGMMAAQDPTTLPDPVAYARNVRAILVTLTRTPPHVEDLRGELHNTQEALTQSQGDLIQAEEQLATTRNTLAGLAARLLEAPVIPGAPIHRQATVPYPDTFEGDMKKYRDFKSKLNNKFRADGPTFRDDQHRLSVAVSLLKEGAADIMRPYLLDDRIDLPNIGEFWQVLDRAFDDPDRQGTAERGLRALRQGKREFAHYFADFMRIKVDLQWNDAAFIEALRTGCSQEIRDVLRNRFEALPRTLQEVADLFNRIDLHNRQWAADNAGHRNQAPPKPPQRQLAPVVPLAQRNTANPA